MPIRHRGCSRSGDGRTRPRLSADRGTRANQRGRATGGVDMKPEEVMRLYDSSYAASYDEKFLEKAPIDADTGYQLELLRSMLTPGVRWLDAACGTGYFLARFPETARAGLDISPAMLEIARERNPGVELRRHDFRDPLPEWQGSFD